MLFTGVCGGVRATLMPDYVCVFTGDSAEKFGDTQRQLNVW